jgi:hypothetical protein
VSLDYAGQRFVQGLLEYGRASVETSPQPLPNLREMTLFSFWIDALRHHHVRKARCFSGSRPPGDEGKVLPETVWHAAAARPTRRGSWRAAMHDAGH